MYDFYIFIRFQACYVACHPKASISFNSSGNFSISYQRPLIIEHGSNIRLNNKTSCMTLYTHYLCHALGGVYMRKLAQARVFRISYHVYMMTGHFISRCLKVHFMLIKYTCDSKSQTLRVRYLFQSTGRPGGRFAFT